MSNTSAFTSTTTLASTATVTSTTPLRDSRSSSRPQTEEEYLALFGALQNQYGFSGAAPMHPSVSKTKKHNPQSNDTSSPRSKMTLTEQEQKFGELAASYGFNGAAPIVPVMAASSNDAKKSLKFWKRNTA
ncbi:hypothetical protein EIP86_004832 [Pleurotus ostreatoroseus]|nr:hypothetical protein EIP86_004832 [Pleurotus ostreatoroseus]